MKSIRKKCIAGAIALLMFLQNVSVYSAQDIQYEKLDGSDVSEEMISQAEADTSAVEGEQLSGNPLFGGLTLPEDEQEAEHAINLSMLTPSEDAVEMIHDGDIVKQAASDVINKDGVAADGDTEWVENTALNAGEEEFPLNSESPYFDSSSLDAGDDIPEASSLVFDETGDSGQIQAAGGDLDAAEPSLSFVSSLSLIKGNSSTVNVKASNYSVPIYLQYAIEGKDIVSAEWSGDWDGASMPLKVTAKSTGTAYIYVFMKAKSDNNVLCSRGMKVEVVTKTTLTSSDSEVTIKQGAARNVRLTYSGTTDLVYMQYSTNNPDVFSCSWASKWSGSSINLTVKGRAPGEGTVYVYLKRATDESTLATTSFKVKVTADAKLTLSSKTVYVAEGDYCNVKVSYSNYDGIAYVNYSSTNSEAYSCEWDPYWNDNSINLKVTGKKEGAGYIYVYLKSAVNDATLATDTITVYASEPKLEASPTELEIECEDTSEILFTPTGVTGGCILGFNSPTHGLFSLSWGNWRGDSVPIIVKGLNEGEATVDVTLYSSSYTVYDKVTVRIKVVPNNKPKVIVDPKNLNLSVGNSSVVSVSVVNADESFYLTFVDSNSSAYDASWGDWNGNTIPLTFTGKAEGEGVVKVQLRRLSDRYTAYSEEINIKVAGNGEENKEEGVDLGRLTYKFENFSEAASLELCKYMFKSGHAQAVYEMELGDGGNCFGMATTAGIYYVPGNGMDVTDFGSGYTKNSDLSFANKCESLGITVKDFIQGMQMTQVASEYDYNIQPSGTDLVKITEDVNYETKYGRPVMICVWGPGGGHAILAYGTEKVSKTETRLLIYDNNYPGKTRYLTLKADGSGKYTYWEYPIADWLIWNSNNGRIAYTNYSMYKNLWDQRGNLSNRYQNLMIANSADFTIYDIYDFPVATVEDGVLSTYDENFKQTFYTGITTDATGSDESVIILHMPIELYTLENNDQDLDEFNVMLVNEDYGVNVKSKCDTITIGADDKCEIATAILGNVQDTEYSIDLYSPNADGETEKVNISGVAEEETISAMIDGDSLETCNISDDDIKTSGEQEEKDNSSSSGSESAAGSSSVKNESSSSERDSTSSSESSSSSSEKKESSSSTAKASTSSAREETESSSAAKASTSSAKGETESSSAAKASTSSTKGETESSSAAKASTSSAKGETESSSAAKASTSSAKGETESSSATKGDASSSADQKNDTSSSSKMSNLSVNADAKSSRDTVGLKNTNIKKLSLDVKSLETISSNELAVTVIKGSKISIDRAAVNIRPFDKKSVAVKKNKKSGDWIVTAKKDGVVDVETGSVTYKIKVYVQTPKAQVSSKNIACGTKPVEKTIRDLFGTDLDRGNLTITQKTGGAKVDVIKNGDVIEKVVINPSAADKIKMEYQLWNKKYKINIKVK